MSTPRPRKELSPIAARLRAAPYLTGAASGLIAKALTMGSQFVNLWLLLQLLSKSQFGSYVFVMALITWIVVIGTAGLDRLVLYRLSRDLAAPGELTGGGLVAAVLIKVLAISAILAAAIAGLAFAVGEQPALPGVAMWLLALAPLTVLICIGRVFEAWFWARGQVSRSLLVPAAADVARTAGLALALWLLPTQAGVAGAVVASGLLPLVIWSVIVPIGKLRDPAPITRADWRYSLQIMLSRGANEGVHQLDVVMLGLLATAAVTAEYAVAAKVAVLIGLGKTLLAPVLTPRLGRYNAAGSRSLVASEYARTRLVGLVSALGFAVLLVVGGRPLLSLLGDFQASYPLLLILCAGSIVSGGFGSNAAYLAIVGHAGWTLVARVGLLCALVVLNLLLIPPFGPMGAAVGMAIGLTAVNILMAVIIWRLDRVPTITLAILLVVAVACATLLATAFAKIGIAAAAAGLTLALLALLAAERARWLPAAKRILKAYRNPASGPNAPV